MGSLPTRGAPLSPQRRGRGVRNERRCAPLYELQGLRGVTDWCPADRPGQRFTDHPGVPANLCTGQKEPLESSESVCHRVAAAFFELRPGLVKLTWTRRIVCALVVT